MADKQRLTCGIDHPAGRAGGTGLKLIEGLVRQVGGTPRWDSTHGTKLVITMPVPSGFSS